jgi:hypothetical protein
MGLWIRRGNENAVFTIGWKKFTETDKIRQVRLNVKVMLTVFLRHGAVHHEFLILGKTANRWYYFKVLKRLRENARRKRPQLSRNYSWFLHHDNMPPHASLLIHDCLVYMNTTVLPQPSAHLTWFWQTFSYFPN